MATTETTTAPTANGTKAAAAAQGDAHLPVYRIPLSEIFFDPAWNARSAKFTSGTGDDGEDRGTAEGIASLKDSMKAGQQDTPIKVRPIPAGYKGPAPKTAKYLAVFGFRRGAALALLAAEEGKMAKDPAWSHKAPTITATIEALDEADALAANIAENTARDDLRAPDLAFQIHNYLSAVPADDTRRRSVSHMAKKFGKVERYVRRLTNISTALLDGKVVDGKKVSPPEPRIFAHWRDAAVHVPVKEMDTLVKNPGPYQAQYDNLVAGSVAVDEEEYHEAIQGYIGWCTTCQAFTRECTEPDATGYDCPECGENAVMGAEEALMAGVIEF
jgi:hypothetical protein